jgi:putative intracellular protease/amidase
MSAMINVLNPDRPKRILMIAANAAVSPTTGWPIGCWIAELSHPWFAFTEKGYHVDIVSPEGGDLQIDGFSDPRHESGYSAHDILSLGFLTSPTHAALLQNTAKLADADLASYDAIFVVGGQSPMVTFRGNTSLQRSIRQAWEGGKVVAIVCHATCLLLETTLSDGTLLAQGKTWTGFADAEEAYADAFVGQRIQPFWIETEARKIEGTNFITGGMFKPFAVRDGRLITGQQQYSGTAAAELVIETLGV